MAINPEQLEAEANAELEALLKGPVEADTPAPEIKESANPEPASNPQPAPPVEKPTDTDSGNWEERYKNLQAHTTKVNQEASDLRRQLGEMQQQLNQLQQSANTGQSGSHKPDDLPEPDELDTAANDFEELAPMVKRLKEQEAFIKELKAQREQESQQRAQQSQQEYYQRIAAVHGDHQQVYQSPEFQGWMQRLSGIDRHAAQFAFNQGTAEDVIEVFNRYKQASGLGNKQDQAAQEAIPSLRSRSQPQTQGRPRWTMAQIAKMSPQEYAKHEAEIDEAIARGEVG